MIKVRLITIGKTSDQYLLPGMEDYKKRLGKYSSFEYLEIPNVKRSKNTTPNEIRRKEQEILLDKFERSDFVVLLDERGKEFTSKGFADYLAGHHMKGTKRLNFIIGGAYGFSEEVYKRANQKIAISQMTFTHQMIRLIFLEQLYRGFTILLGEKYHH